MGQAAQLLGQLRATCGKGYGIRAAGIVFQGCKTNVYLLNGVMAGQGRRQIPVLLPVLLRPLIQRGGQGPIPLQRRLGGLVQIPGGGVVDGFQRVSQPKTHRQQQGQQA